MSKTDYKDIEKSWLVEYAVYDHDFPKIATATDIPASLIPFSKSRSSKDFRKWVHFYEQDYEFVQLRRNPKRYLPLLQKFGGIISPDFSIYADAPWPIQAMNKYWNHALAFWLSIQKIPVIPNVRWGGERSYDFCFYGIEKNSIVAVGTHGQLKKAANKKLFLAGLPKMIETLSPHTIIVYGKAPDDIFGRYREEGIKIIPFSSETEQYYARGKVGA